MIQCWFVAQKYSTGFGFLSSRLKVITQTFHPYVALFFFLLQFDWAIRVQSVTLHVAPFAHGLASHSLMSASQYSPE
jgi:hypothetical protein